MICKPRSTEVSRRLNDMLDCIPGDGAPFVDGRNPRYFVIGSGAMLIGVVLFVVLGKRFGIATVLLVGDIAMAFLAFVCASWIRSVLRARHSSHVLLEDLFAVIGTIVCFGVTSGQPVRTLVDVMVIVLGVFLCLGRMGCLAGGCCHGMPSSVGVLYRHAHGIAHDLLGIRLFPIQLVEALWILGVTAIVWGEYRVGTLAVCGHWLAFYCIGRFVFEFARGDERPKFHGLSGAQWHCVVVVSVLTLAEGWRDGIGREAWLASASGVVSVVLVIKYGRWSWLYRQPSFLEVVDIAVAGERILLAEQQAVAQAACSRVTLGDGVGVDVLAQHTRPGEIRFSYFVQCTNGWVDAVQVGGMVLQRYRGERVNGAVSVGWTGGGLWLEQIVRAEGLSTTTRQTEHHARIRSLAFGLELRRALVLASRDSVEIVIRTDGKQRNDKT